MDNYHYLLYFDTLYVLIPVFCQFMILGLMLHQYLFSFHYLKMESAIQMQIQMQFSVCTQNTQASIYTLRALWRGDIHNDIEL